MDDCFDRIYEVLSRAKAALAELSKKYLSEGGRRFASGLPLAGLPASNDVELAAALKTSVLRGVMGGPGEEWELAPLPRWNFPPTGAEEKGRKRMYETEEGERGAGAGENGDRRLRRNRRGEQRKKRLRVLLQKEVYVDRSLT